MAHYLVVFCFIVFGFSFMALMLHFSQYRRRRSVCCGEVLEAFEKGDACDTCPNKDTGECALSG
ncbi:MAG: hypothetical protein ACE5IY_04080 [bacterium]